jgi:hypothetical protein
MRVLEYAHGASSGLPWAPGESGGFPAKRERFPRIRGRNTVNARRFRREPPAVYPYRSCGPVDPWAIHRVRPSLEGPSRRRTRGPRHGARQGDTVRGRAGPQSPRGRSIVLGPDPRGLPCLGVAVGRENRQLRVDPARCRRSTWEMSNDHGLFPREIGFDEVEVVVRERERVEHARRPEVRVALDQRFHAHPTAMPGRKCGGRGRGSRR